MALNPDPKAGRWILPLVILAMVAFTYFFVSALPEASPDTTLAAGPTTTTIPDTSQTTNPGGTGGGLVDGVTQEYLDELDAINALLQVLDTEMIAVNEGFDADPREIEYPDAESRLEVVATDARSLADQVAALTVPLGLEDEHLSVSSAIGLCASAAEEALAGLQSADEGDLRRAASAAFATSVGDFDTEIQNTRAAAGAA